MIITKKEAKKLKICWRRLCQFHIANPDQDAIMNTCQDCKIIQEPCGCGFDESCELCDSDLKKKVESK